MRILLSISFLGCYTTSIAQTNKRTLGNKSYELSNHLGNVMVVVSDRKTPAPETTNTTIAFNETDIIAFNDYYPYGMLLDGRNESKDYRFGFQGQEKDNEVKGSNNSINYKYRVHDPRLGRFFGVDPLSSKYPYNSTYAFSENIVINAIEMEGLEKVDSYDKEYLTERGIEKTYSYNHDNNPMDNQSPFANNPIVEAVPIYSRVSNDDEVNLKQRQEGWLIKRKFSTLSKMEVYRVSELAPSPKSDIIVPVFKRPPPPPVVAPINPPIAPPATPPVVNNTNVNKIVPIQWDLLEATMSNQNWTKLKDTFDEVVQIFNNDPTSFYRVNIIMGATMTYNNSNTLVPLAEAMGSTYIKGNASYSGKTFKELINARKASLKNVLSQMGIPSYKINISVRMSHNENINVQTD
ncbi:RHS repeat domain-containing protein [Marixanthomonas ophiurae]|nr:RHS repeat-associated core domain-containing protein [Marixanthomonas ophiurae]